MGRKHAAERGYVCIAELAEDDRGASGAKIELPKLNEVLEMARQGEFDVLIVRELDRLSRDLAKQLIVEQELARSGVSIEYVLYDFPDTPEGHLNKNIRAMLAEYEREKINQRMSRGRRQRVKRGNVMFHGHPPYGYRQVKRDSRFELVIDEEEAEIVRLIFHWSLFGDERGETMGTVKIAARLTEMGVLTFTDKCERNVKKKKRKRGAWSYGTVYGMLRNETYAGVWRYGKTDIEVEVPAIIDKETWDAVQRKLKANKQKSKRNTKHRYLLRLRVTCGKCGLKVRGQSRTPYKGGKLYLYYRCPANSRGVYAHDCDLPSFRVELVDQAAWEWIVSILDDPDYLIEGLEAQKQRQEEEDGPLQQRIAVIDQLLAQHEGELNKLLDLFLSGDFPKEWLMERKDRYEQTIRRLKEEREEVLSMLNPAPLTDAQVTEIKSVAAQIREEMDLAEADYHEKRRLVEWLDVRATLLVEDGKRKVQFSCVLEGESWSVNLDNTGSGRRSSCRSRRRWS